MAPDLADDLAHTTRLADGRELGYAELGRPDGEPLIWFHGTPSSRLEVVWLDQAASGVVVGAWWPSTDPATACPVRTPGPR